MKEFKTEVTEFLKKETKLNDISLEVPPNHSLGDFAFPCFNLAKEFKKSPVVIAKELQDKFKETELIKEAKATGPYINFFIKSQKLFELIIKKALKEKDFFGSNSAGKGKKILVEHTSINPNASPHVGRARNAIIGDSIVRLLKFQKYEVETHFYVNDVGKQIAMLVIGSEGKKDIKFEDLLEIYIDINDKAKKDNSIEKQVFDLLYQLEKGDKKVKGDFKRIVDICIKGQSEIFSELDIRYDFFDYESKFLWDKKTDMVLKELEKTGKLFIDEDDRFVLDLAGFGLGMKSPVFVLTRADKTSLYGLRDIAYTIEKVNKGKNIVVLGEDQKLYFEQIKASLKLMGYASPEVVHYSFVLLEEGKMSTRKGTLVLLEDFMNESLKKARDGIIKRHEECNEETAKAIAYGAIKYAILRVSSEKNVIFNWESALNFEGESAPYIQYSYARISSILRRKEDADNSEINYSLLSKPEELRLLKKTAEFFEVIEKTAESLKPHILANYLFELASGFSEFYHSCPVLKEENEVKKARLALISCVKQVLYNGMNILGINMPEKM